MFKGVHNMYRMVIFDLDGTLLNTLDDLAYAGNYALSLFNLPVHETEKYRYFIGNGIPKLIERILPENYNYSTYNKVYNSFCSYYEYHMNDYTKPYDGIINMLETFKKNNIVSVVVTNKSDEFANSIVGEYFGDLIEKTYGSIEGYPKKPDPYWVNKAVLDFGICKSDIIYIGDSGVDMQTAVNSGIFACGVSWGFREREELVEYGADIICSGCSEIIKIVL